MAKMYVLCVFIMSIHIVTYIIIVYSVTSLNQTPLRPKNAYGNLVQGGFWIGEVLYVQQSIVRRT